MKKSTLLLLAVGTVAFWWAFSEWRAHTVREKEARNAAEAAQPERVLQMLTFSAQMAGDAQAEVEGDCYVLYGRRDVPECVGRAKADKDIRAEYILMQEHLRATFESSFMQSCKAKFAEADCNALLEKEIAIARRKLEVHGPDRDSDE